MLAAAAGGAPTHAGPASRVDVVRRSTARSFALLLPLALATSVAGAALVSQSTTRSSDGGLGAALRDITAGVGAASVQARLTSNSEASSLAERVEHRLPLFVAAVALAALLALAEVCRTTGGRGRGRWELLQRSAASN